MKITEKNISRLHAGLTAPKVFTDDRLSGLCLNVTPRGKARWLFRSQAAGAPAKVSIGPFPIVGYHEAYDLALKIAQDVFAGRSPKAAKAKRERAHSTLRPFADKYLADNKGNWASTTHTNWTSKILILGEALLDLPAGDIDSGILADHVEKIRNKWKITTENVVVNQRGEYRAMVTREVGGVTAAADFLRMFKTILDIARSKLGVEVMPLSADEIVSGAKIASKAILQHKVVHMASLPYLRAPELLRLVRGSNRVQRLYAAAFELVILNASRFNEVVGGEWPEVDLDRGVWVIPASRMKGKTHKRGDHTLVLAPRSIEILTELRAAASAAGVDSKFIFDGALSSGGRPGQPVKSNSVRQGTIGKIQLKNDAGADLPVTMHGFRSTFKSWAEDSGKYNYAVSEAQIDHAMGGKVQASYDRAERLSLRKQIVTDWADFVCGAKPFETVLDDIALSQRAA
jgi:integrase